MINNGQSSRKSNNGDDNNMMLPNYLPPKQPIYTKKKPWKKGTCLIVGDSTLNGLKESKMSYNGTIVVRSFPGAVVGDFYNYLEPLMEKLPSKLVIHAGTNDSINKNSTDILNELLQLKTYLEERFRIDVCLSCPTIRVDNVNAKKTVTDLCLKLNQLDIKVICNKNIDETCLGTGGNILVCILMLRGVVGSPQMLSLIIEIISNQIYPV